MPPSPPAPPPKKIRFIYTCKSNESQITIQTSQCYIANLTNWIPTVLFFNKHTPQCRKIKNLNLGFELSLALKSNWHTTFGNCKRPPFSPGCIAQRTDLSSALTCCYLQHKLLETETFRRNQKTSHMQLQNIRSLAQAKQSLTCLF